MKDQIYRYYYGAYELSFSNQENESDYDFTLQSARAHRVGVSAMLRIKNEADTIIPCLRSIQDVFDEIVIVDNGSKDATRTRISSYIREFDAINVKIYDYPFFISRCGAEHESTPENSVHSLAYFYNWCLSKCTCTHVFKWDGDMVLPRGKKTELANILKTTRKSGLRLWNIRGQTVYLDSQGTPWAAIDEINFEERIFNNNPAIHYVKDKLWERLTYPTYIQEEYPEAVVFHELKDVRKNEFDHWTDLENLSARKQREYKNYQKIKLFGPDSGFTKVTRSDLYLD